VEADGTQRLWRFTADGRDSHLVFDAIKPVGYHAWADDRTVVLYVLGQPGTNQPSTLHVADSRTGTERQVAIDVGRSLQRIPGTSHVSFVQRQRIGDKVTLTIQELDPSSGSIKALTPAVEGATEADCAWLPDGTLLMAHDDRLYAWRRTTMSSAPSSWREVASFDRLGVHGVTRLAVSPKGDRIALVATP